MAKSKYPLTLMVRGFGHNVPAIVFGCQFLPEKIDLVVSLDFSSRSDILQGQALFREVEQLLIREKNKKRNKEK